MLFRSQHIWLLLAAILAILTYEFPFYNGQMLRGNILQHQNMLASFSPITRVLTGTVALGCIVLIFLYKRPELQWMLAIAALAISLCNIIVYFKSTREFEPGTGALSFSALLSFVIPVVLFLAVRKIRRDEKLLAKKNI